MKNKQLRILVIILIILWIFFVIKNVKKGPVVNEKNKKEYLIETVLSENLSKEVQGKKSAIIRAGTQTNVTSQAQGRIAGIYVRAGEKVYAGQAIASIEDTYGSTNNALEEARIALETSTLSLESTTLSLDQSLASTKISYEKALKDYEATKLSITNDPLTGKSKAQLDYENFLTTQEKTLSGYETTYQSQLQSFQSFLANVIDTSDTLLGVSDAKRNGNNSFEFLLWAADPAQKTTTESSLEKLLPYKVWAPDASLPLIDRVIELQRVYNLASEVLSGMEKVLIATVVDSTRMPAATLAAHRTTIDGYQAQYSSISTGLVSYLNAAQTFLATYENERLSREKAIQTTEENSSDTLKLAKNAYTTSEKTREVTLRQLNQNIAAATIRLRNAQGNVNRLTITAPISGIVGRVLVDEGEEVNMGRAIIEIASDNAECEITVDSNTLRQLSVGKKLTVDYQWENLPARIASISPIADTGLNFSVKISLDTSVAVYGDFASISLPLMSIFPVIPINSVAIISPWYGQINILKQSTEGPLLETKNVTLGSLWGDKIEITSDLGNVEIILTEMKTYTPENFILKKKS